MEIVRLKPGSPLWKKTIVFAENCSWSAGAHIAKVLQENKLTEWEAFFAAVDNQTIIGCCSFLKEDYYPDNKYMPWISSIFVTESARGKKVSHQMIQAVLTYAKEQKFSRVYIPSDMTGFYEKCGFTPIDTLKNYDGNLDTIFMREL